MQVDTLAGPTLTGSERRTRIGFVVAALALFSLFVIGMFSLITSHQETATITLAYTAGLSMILLPCTLPAVLVIVPLSMGRGYRRGLAMALLFGGGLSLTLSAYGVAMAVLGKVLYLDQVSLYMWLVAGLAAYVFGLNELGLLPLELPSYMGQPQFIHRKGDYTKALLLGILLGNAGIGCPNPAFYVLLTYFATTAEPVTSGLLGLVHGIGRATPLVALSILAILGINLTRWVLTKREVVQRATGWGLIGVAALLLPKPLMGHAWWEESVFHKLWNKAVGLILGPQVAESGEIERQLGDMPVHDPWLLYGPWIFLAVLLSIPRLWGMLKNMRQGEGVAHAPILER